MNEILRRALAESGLDETEVATRLNVDPKTVHRWITEGRTPYPRHQEALTSLLGLDGSNVWPEALNFSSSGPNSAVDLRASYPHRWAVPHEVWQSLFASAQQEISILVYAGLFLAEDKGVMSAIAERARAGVSVRLLLGDPDSPYVAERGTDEGIGDSIAAKIRNALILYQPLRDIEGVEIRLHQTTLYASIYQADDQLLVNPHIYGVPAANAPVLHLHRADDADMTNTYLASFERIWLEANPVK